jgi:hypothetical protein
VITHHSSIAFACSGLIAATSLFAAIPSTANKPIKPTPFPTTGKVLSLTNGDLMCYVELIDSRGVKYNLGADFDVCSQTKLRNKKVNLTYKRGKVSDCQTSPDCGKTRIENLIVKMKLVPRK